MLISFTKQDNLLLIPMDSIYIMGWLYLRMKLEIQVDYLLIIDLTYLQNIFQSQIKPKHGAANGFLVSIIYITEKMPNH